MKTTCNTAVILAGGKSNRLPFDKQTIEIKGSIMPIFIANRLSKEFDRVIIVSNKPSLYKNNCPYEVVSDTYVGLGPKAGIIKGLEISEDDFVYFIGCDMPYINLSFIRYMKTLINESKEKPDIIVSIKNGYYEPLNAFYSKALIPTLGHQLNEGNNKISTLYSESNVMTINDKILTEFDPKNLMFINLNTPKDFASLESGVKL